MKSPHLITVVARALAGALPLRAAETHNTLTAAEKAAGWQLLFDGKTTKGWRSFLGKEISPEVWRVDNGEIHCRPKFPAQDEYECGFAAANGTGDADPKRAFLRCV